MNERIRTKTTLETLIKAGLLREGERLYASIGGRHLQERHFEAELVGGDRVRIVSDGLDGSLNGREYASASAAITALYGRPDGGWKNWKVERDGERVTLETIRHEHDLGQQRPTLEALDDPASSVDVDGPTATPAEISPRCDS